MLPKQKIVLPGSGGTKEISKFTWKEFRLWRGEPLDERVRKKYGKKPVIDCNGKGIFAELAIIPVLKSHGLDGAVWADNYGRCFRDAMPFLECALPKPLHDSYGRIVAENRGCAGCWDVIGWERDEIMFVECKWKRKDRMQPNGIKWLEAALNVGIPLERFAICEWEFPPS